MFEFEDMSSGFHDSFLSKYADSSGPIYDIFISDSMQDMLDIDIRAEVATVVGGHTNDFASLIDGDLPSLDGIESYSLSDADIFTGGPKYTPPIDYFADLGACVNPNSVMPLINSSSSLLNSPKFDLNTINFAAHSPPQSPQREQKFRSNLNFSSISAASTPPASTSSPVTAKHITIHKNEVKMPLSIATAEKRQHQQQQQQLQQQITATMMKSESIDSECKSSVTNTTTKGVLHSLAPGIGGLTFANTIDYNKFKQQSSLSNSSVNNICNKVSTTAISHNGNLVLKKDRDSSPLHNMATLHSSNYANSHHHKFVTSRNITHHKISSSTPSPPVTTKATKVKPIAVDPEFPKPAYSYSCLIAMALKNSRSGSLPVSEIYSFMCEHFPYFKTAPNGWKNSVRHNLSLNKCFEKIEKPPTNGGQRKGCLWAMNPAKITKMDEEVLKWSRKDPMAIRNAMVYPENLEALERGEMKHGSTGDEDGEGEIISDLEENSDVEHEIDDNIVVETPESYIEEEEEDRNSPMVSIKRERDFDDEVQVYYNAIEEEDKDALHAQLALKHDFIEFSAEEDFQANKRQRLNLNYSIGPAGSFIEHQPIKQQQQFQQLHQISSSPTAPQQHRRKMQIINRISSI